MKIWQKYFFKEQIKHMLFFLLCLYLIYIIIDLSLQSGRLIFHSQCHFIDILLYYLYYFLLRANFLIPLSFLLAMIKTLSSMNIHNELTSLRMAGISSLQLSIPFLIISGIFCLFIFSNEQYLEPIAASYIEKFQKTHLQEKKEKNRLSLSVHRLDDGSKFICQKQTSNPDMLYDIFWIKAKNEIWHIKHVNIKEASPIAHYIDIFTKKENEGFYKTNSLDTFTFDRLHLKEDALGYSMENQSLKKLLSSSFFSYTSTDEKARALSYLLFKINLCFFPILIVLSIFLSAYIFERCFLLSSLLVGSFRFYYSLYFIRRGSDFKRKPSFFTLYDIGITFYNSYNITNFSLQKTN